MSGKLPKFHGTGRISYHDPRTGQWVEKAEELPDRVYSSWPQEVQLRFSSWATRHGWGHDASRARSCRQVGFFGGNY